LGFAPELVTVNSAGLLTATGKACGNTIVSATVDTNSSARGISSSGAIVTSDMTATVVCFSDTALLAPFPAVNLRPQLLEP
jgi:hypothetical protein